MGSKLQDLMLKLKGSSSSGNYGHSGRPGSVGGSAPNAQAIYKNIKQKLGITTDVKLEITDLSDYKGEGEMNGEYRYLENKIVVSDKLQSKVPELGAHVTHVDGLESLIAHELEHVKDGGDSKIITKKSEELDRLFTNVKDRIIEDDLSIVISRYALSSPTEYYCEGLAAYVTNPTSLKQKDPDLYNFIEGTL